MKICIAENIYNMRKAHNMRQEQLAEAVDVSVAAVSKWERGQATPDLIHIVRMAELFEVAVDALIGYQVENNACRECEERIFKLQQEKRFEDAVVEVEKALTRYPNDFRLVHRCSELYQIKGSETGDKKAIERAIELWNRAIGLLSQNDNSEINEHTIRSEIASCYIILGEIEKGLELLKQCNIGGIHNATIGMVYMESKKYDADEALPYLTNAFLKCMESLIRTMDGYANYFMKKKDYESALDAGLWITQYMESIKKPGKANFLDKFIAGSYTSCAYLAELLERDDDATQYLKKAFVHQQLFDATPSYNVRDVKFCLGEIEDATVYENMGVTAMESVERKLKDLGCSEKLCLLWKNLKEGDDYETLE